MNKLKSICLALVAIFVTSISPLLGQSASDIVGVYLTEKQNAKVRIYPKGDRFYGLITWTVTSGKLDENNPEEHERTKPLVDKVILKDFVYSGDNLWEKGTIYDPESGKTYSCKITRTKEGKLKVRGFIGISLIGRNSIWTPSKS